MNAAQAYLACYVIFERNGKILFVKRANTGFMDGFYGLPAGRVDPGESVLHAAVREAQEEVGISIKLENLTHIHTAYRESDPEHTWIDVYFRAAPWDGEPINNEPERHSEIAWLEKSDLPDNIQYYVAAALKNISSGKTYSEHLERD